MKDVNNPIEYAIKNKWITLSVLTGMFTWKMVNSFKDNVIDPILEVSFPDGMFDFLKIHIGGPKEPIVSNINEPKLSLSISKTSLVRFSLTSDTLKLKSLQNSSKTLIQFSLPAVISSN